MDTPTNKSKAPSVADLKRLKDLLIWAKENEIQLHEVDFGSCKITLTDLELFQVDEEEGAADYTGGTNVAEPKSMYDDMLRRRGVTPNNG